MLVLIGLGLEAKDISVRALEELKRADAIYLERYTAQVEDKYVRYLEQETGKKLVELHRQDLEDRLDKTISAAKVKNIAILFPGDPLIATTHKIIFDYARKSGIKTKTLHSVSILTVAIGESGLDAYRFGPVITIPFWQDGYKPVSFIDSIRKNLENNEHSLLLLDIDQKNSRFMNLHEAFDVLKKADAQGAKTVIADNTSFVMIANGGKESQVVRYGKMSELEKIPYAELKDKILSLVLPAKLSFVEQESLKRFE
jgi:diphthine synthase